MRELDPELMLRIERLDRVVIRHSSWAKAYEGILECMKKSGHCREPENCLLLASGGMGKTLTCLKIVSEFPRYVRDEETGKRSIIPAFYAEIPSPATVKSVASELLKQLNDPNPDAGSCMLMTRRLCKLLRTCETRLVLLDEIHNLFDLGPRTTKINRKVCAWIKKLVNDSGVTFCLVGLPRIEPLLELEDDEKQLSRRFKWRYRLDNLGLGSEGQPPTLQPFLKELRKSILKIFEVESFPTMESDLHSLQIFAATSGNPSYIMSLVREVMIDVFTAGRLSASIDDFATVWDKGILLGCHLTKKNPFAMSKAKLAAELRTLK